MDVEAAHRRDVEHRLRQDQAIGGDHRDLGRERGELRLRLGRAERAGTPHRNPARLRRALHAPGCSFLPRPAGRGGWV